MTLLCGALAGCGRASAAPQNGSSVGSSFALHECRLEHPQRVASIAARCGILAVAENPAAPTGAHIGLYVAVVPALNRRSTAAPLFILAGGP